MADHSVSFSHQRWEELLAGTIRQIASLSALKGGEYAGDDDRLANFRRNAEAMGLTMEQVWRVYAGKHWDAVTQYIKDLSEGRDRVRSEPISGRADDLIVYLILLKAMVEERQQPPIEEKIGYTPPPPVLCSHQWHKLDRFTDTCVFCNEMRPRRSLHKP